MTNRLFNKIFILLSLLLITAGALHAQTFNITRVEMEGDLVNVYYNLLDTTAHRTYTVDLLSSRDNFITPLEKVSGNVGLEIKPGPNQKISWNTREELGNTFAGEVVLEVRGRVYIPFVRLDGLYTSMKRTRPYEITWTGGTQQNILNFDLYKGEEKITSFPNIANVGHYTLTIPKNVKTGKDYNFKITDSKNKDQIVITQPFRIKPKFPLILKAAAVAIVGGVIYYFVSREPAASPAEENKEVPVAPGHPN